MKALHQRALDLYDILDRHATEEEGQKVFRGSITQAFRELEISQSHYSNVQKLLVAAGAIELVQRGARGIPSVFVLHGKPEAETFSPIPLTGVPKPDMFALAQAVKDIQRQIGGLDIVRALADLEKRVGKLEKKGQDA